MIGIGIGSHSCRGSLAQREASKKGTHIETCINGLLRKVTLIFWPCLDHIRELSFAFPSTRTYNRSVPIRQFYLVLCTSMVFRHEPRLVYHSLFWNVECLFGDCPSRALLDSSVSLLQSSRTVNINCNVTNLFVPTRFHGIWDGRQCSGSQYGSVQRQSCIPLIIPMYQLSALD